MAGLFEGRSASGMFDPPRKADESLFAPRYGGPILFGPGKRTADMPNMMPPEVRDADEFIASGPGRHRSEGQGVSYRKRK